MCPQASVIHLKHQSRYRWRFIMRSLTSFYYIVGTACEEEGKSSFEYRLSKGMQLCYMGIESRAVTFCFDCLTCIVTIVIVTFLGYQIPSWEKIILWLSQISFNDTSIEVVLLQTVLFISFKRTYIHTRRRGLQYKNSAHFPPLIHSEACLFIF